MSTRHASLLYGDRAFEAAKVTIQDADTIVHAGNSHHVNSFFAATLSRSRGLGLPKKLKFTSQHLRKSGLFLALSQRLNELRRAKPILSLLQKL